MLVNKRIIASIAILAGATLLMAGAGAIPAIMSINALEQKIAGEHAKIEVRYVTRQSVRDSLSELERAKTEVASLKRIAVIEGEELDFINALESTVESAGVDARFSLEMANQRILSFWEREVPIRINITGNTSNIIGFLDGIERLPYAVTIDSVAVRRNNTQKQGSVAADLSGTIYWLSKEAPNFVHTGTTASPSDK